MSFIDTRRIGKPGLMYLTFCSVVHKQKWCNEKPQENNFPSRVFKVHASKGMLQSRSTKIQRFGFPESLTDVISASLLISRTRSSHTTHTARGLRRGAHSRCLGCTKALGGLLQTTLSQPPS